VRKYAVQILKDVEVSSDGDDDDCGGDDGDNHHDDIGGDGSVLIVLYIHPIQSDETPTPHSLPPLLFF